MKTQEQKLKAKVYNTIDDIVNIKLKNASTLINMKTKDFIIPLRNYTIYSDEDRHLYTIIYNNEEKTYASIYDTQTEKFAVKDWEVYSYHLTKDEFGFQEVNDKILYLKSPIDDEIHMFNNYTYKTEDDIFNLSLAYLPSKLNLPVDSYYVVGINNLKYLYYINDKIEKSAISKQGYDDITNSRNNRYIVYSKNNKIFFSDLLNISIDDLAKTNYMPTINSNKNDDFKYYEPKKENYNDEDDDYFSFYEKRLFVKNGSDSSKFDNMNFTIDNSNLLNNDNKLVSNSLYDNIAVIPLSNKDGLIVLEKDNIYQLGKYKDNKITLPDKNDEDKKYKKISFYSDIIAVESANENKTKIYSYATPSKQEKLLLNISNKPSTSPSIIENESNENIDNNNSVYTIDDTIYIYKNDNLYKLGSKEELLEISTLYKRTYENDSTKYQLISANKDFYNQIDVEKNPFNILDEISKKEPQQVLLTKKRK